MTRAKKSRIMNKFILPEGETQPGVLFDPDRKILRIWGRSSPEDTFEFYEPIIKWLEEYFAQDPEDVELELALTYYNTSTSKIVMHILQMIDALYSRTGAAKVIWYYLPGDEDMLMNGEDYSELVKVPFEIKPM